MNDNPPPGEPKFSVIMPVYNHAEFVGQAIDSVRRQTFQRWELLVIDDGSTDGSGQVARRRAEGDGRVRVICQVNAGPAAARNAGIRLAKAAWLTFLDSDDVWDPLALANFDAALSARPGAQFVYGYRHRLNPDSSVTELPARFQDRPTGPVELFGRMHLSHLCVCYRRELAHRAGLYDESLRTCEDYELYLRMSLLTGFEPINRLTGLRRRHGRNISRRTGRSKFLEAEVLRRFIDKQGGKAVVPPDLVARRLGRVYHAAGREYFRARLFRQALAALSRSACYRKSPRPLLLWLLCRMLCPLTSNDEPLPLLK